MKKYKTGVLILLFLILAVLPAVAQEDFKVIKVNGSILLKARGVSLETGTVFSEKEDLLFRSEDATAAVINSQKGRLVLTSRNHDLSAASSNYMPSMYNISSRSGSLLNNSDLTGLFSGRYVVIERQGIEVDNNEFPMDDNHFFFLRYTFKGEEINKKLSFLENTFFIDKTTLFTVDGNPIPSADNTSIKLYYRKGDESLFISRFDLIFPDIDQLSLETEVILSEINEKATEEKIREVGSYINEYYGKIAREDLAGWLETRFAIK